MNNQYELYHYGILGMKWGIRRYQNDDGSLTSAGKKHYGEGTHVGSKARLKRAIDARKIDNKIGKLTRRRSTDRRDAKVERLTKMRDGLMKDLDAKENRYAELFIQRKAARKEINRIQIYSTIGSNLMSGVASRKLARAVKQDRRYDREIYKLASEFRKNRRKAKAEARGK